MLTLTHHVNAPSINTYASTTPTITVRSAPASPAANPILTSVKSDFEHARYHSIEPTLARESAYGQRSTMAQKHHTLKQHLEDPGLLLQDAEYQRQYKIMGYSWLIEQCASADSVLDQLLAVYNDSADGKLDRALLARFYELGRVESCRNPQCKHPDCDELNPDHIDSDDDEGLGDRQDFRKDRHPMLELAARTRRDVRRVARRAKREMRALERGGGC